MPNVPAIKTETMPAELSDLDKAIQLETVTAELIQSMGDATNGVKAVRGHANSVKQQQATLLGLYPTCDHIARTVRTILDNDFPFSETTSKANKALYNWFRNWRDEFRKQGIAISETNPEQGGYEIDIKRDTAKGAESYTVAVNVLVPAAIESRKAQAIEDSNREAERAEGETELRKQALAAEVQRTPVQQLAQQLVGYVDEVMPGVNKIELAAALTDLVNMDLTTATK